MVTLDAETLTEARRERASLLAGLREGRSRAPEDTTVAALFADYLASRNLSPRTQAHEGTYSPVTWSRSRDDARRT